MEVERCAWQTLVWRPQRGYLLTLVVDQCFICRQVSYRELDMETGLARDLSLYVYIAMQNAKAAL